VVGKIFGVNRARIGIDGPGITTLVAMYRCPLNCEYCINNPINQYYEYTVEDLYEELKIDSLYFDYTGGGICFGGHEPLLQQDFLIEFIKYVKELGHNWKFGLETSANCLIKQELLDLLDYLIIDIKTINQKIYKQYTEVDNSILIKNLQLLVSIKNLDISIRIPIIPGYNDMNDVKQSVDYLISLGYYPEQVEIFEYITELN
jgi:pyruvate formate lyase activating enzyme